MRMFYDGQHRHQGASPECNCAGSDRPGPVVLVHGEPHREKCVIVAERNARLMIGAGGSR